jgi:hypothetical protein
MPIDQNLLLHAALQYQEKKNQQYSPGGRLVPIPKKRIVIIHSLDAIRLVEGLIVLLQEVGIDAWFDWHSGYFSDSRRPEYEREQLVKVSNAQTCIFFCTKGSISSECCRHAYDLAVALDRQVYVVLTQSGDQKWEPMGIDSYNQLTIQQVSPTSNSFVAKIRDKRFNRIWKQISSEAQL